MDGWNVIRVVVGVIALIWGALCWSAYFASLTPAYRQKMRGEIKKESPDATDQEIADFEKFFRLVTGAMGGASVAVFLVMCLALR